jgi:hypothetical protein
VRRGQADSPKIRIARARGTSALLVASAVHALVLVALLVAPLRRRTPRAPPAPPPDASFEVTTEAVEAASRDEVAVKVAPGPERAHGDMPSAALAAPRSAAAPHDAEVAREEPVAIAEPSPTSIPSPLVATTMPAAPPAIGLALGTPNVFVSRAASERPPTTSPAPDDRHVRTAAEAKRAVETALREPARQRERELGLGPEGPVLQALGDATSASSAPVKGRAVFRAVADGTGMIVGIEVLECDGGRPGWANAAELARRALQGKKLRMPSTATLAEMRIEIVSDWKMPSGHDPGTDVSILGVPVAKGEGKKSTKIDLLDPIPKIEMVELAPDVKVPIPQVNVRILAVQGDPADIGAKPRRVVHTRLLDSKVL